MGSVKTERGGLFELSEGGGMLATPLIYVGLYRACGREMLSVELGVST